MKPSLIIVDDVEGVREYLHVTLQEHFEILEEVVDAVSAQDAILRQEPDLVLLDIVMPRESGLEVLRAYQKIRNQRKLTHFVVHSGCSREEIIREAFRLGAFDYLIKPVDEKTLVQSLKASLLNTRLSQ